MSSYFALTLLVLAVFSGLSSFCSCHSSQGLDPYLHREECNQPCWNALQQQVEVLTRDVEELLKCRGVLRVNGRWTPWGSYGSCSKSCGGGTQERQRNCTNPEPVCGGANCSGPSLESKPCNTQPCPVNGRWTPWGSYGSCSKSCGGGTQERQRNCTNPEPAHGGDKCSGSSLESRSCNTQPCPVNGRWTPWGSYGSCSKSCGGGTQERHRDCTNPAPAHGGDKCSGPSLESRSCNTQPCPGMCTKEGYSLWLGKYCTKVYTKPASFAMAEGTCVKEGAHLFHAKTTNNIEALISIIRGAGFHGQNFWVGASDRRTEGRWLWTDGTPVNSDVWHPREPNNERGEDCAELWYQPKKLNDIGCEKSRKYVCQTD